MCNRNQYLEIATRKAGAMTRVCYKTNLATKLCAKAKHEGYVVEKITETTGRVGCNYNNMTSVKERRANGEISERNYTDPYEWVIPNRIKKHKEKGTEYLVLGTVPKSNTKTKYIITHGLDVRVVDELSEDDKELFIKSYVDGNKYKPEVLTIKLDNLITFNGVA